MGKIILARHGQDKYNSRQMFNGLLDAGLTHDGFAQAYCLAQKVQRNFDIRIVVSSSLIRAVQTAQQCALWCQTHHIVLDYLKERSHGILEGQPYSEIPRLAKAYKEVNGNLYVLEVDGGESYPELRSRAERELADLKAYYASLRTSGDMLVVSHGALIRSMIGVHKGISLDDQWTIPSLGNCEYVVLE